MVGVRETARASTGCIRIVTLVPTSAAPTALTMKGFHAG